MSYDNYLTWTVYYFGFDNGEFSFFKKYDGDSYLMYHSVMARFSDDRLEFADVFLGNKYICSIDRDGRAHFDGVDVPSVF